MPNDHSDWYSVRLNALPDVHIVPKSRLIFFLYCFLPLLYLALIGHNEISSYIETNNQGYYKPMLAPREIKVFSSIQKDSMKRSRRLFPKDEMQWNMFTHCRTKSIIVDAVDPPREDELKALSKGGNMLISHPAGKGTRLAELFYFHPELYEQVYDRVLESTLLDQLNFVETIFALDYLQYQLAICDFKNVKLLPALMLSSADPGFIGKVIVGHLLHPNTSVTHVLQTHIAGPLLKLYRDNLGNFPRDPALIDRLLIVFNCIRLALLHESSTEYGQADLFSRIDTSIEQRLHLDIVQIMPHLEDPKLTYEHSIMFHSLLLLVVSNHDLLEHPKVRASMLQDISDRIKALEIFQTDEAAQNVYDLVQLQLDIIKTKQSAEQVNTEYHRGLAFNAELLVSKQPYPDQSHGTWFSYQGQESTELDGLYKLLQLGE